MNSLKYMSISALIIVVSACSTTKNKMADAKYMEDKASTTASSQTWEREFAHVAQVGYAKGSKMLSEADKREIRQLIQTGNANGKIGEIKVLAWADRDFSKSGKPTSAEIDLANERADAIKDFIKSEVGFTDVDTHNMAKNPGSLARLFKTDDYELKSGSFDSDGKVFKPVPSPQKAVVLLEMENDGRYRAE